MGNILGYAEERDCPWIEQLIDQFPTRGSSYELMDAFVESATSDYKHVLLIELDSIGFGAEDKDIRYLVVRLRTGRVIEKAQNKLIGYATNKYDRLPRTMPIGGDWPLSYHTRR